MMNDLEQRLIQTIRDVPDFPKPGILFKDITPVLSDAALSAQVLDALAEYWSKKGIGAVAGIESRGFLFGSQLAIRLGVPFIPIRKKGKLPYKTIGHAYDLEYGSAEIEIHVDAVLPGQKVLIHDDLLATGGTAGATAQLIQKAGGTVSGFSFLIELSFLKGAEELKSYSMDIHSILKY
ncbi:adenine phosphoribosyltransferase [Marinoscillum sp. MHG1-6]|uniref:adenine phosphoribosyltransferase n=1 Tax=Marinoscillum sp. MHG1-6 TaxID=2959627 RepID=UPI00215844C1|nr:adenine phosphoribosyltransferase [Marinoscillum sp. MHG1-6]